MKRNHSPGVSSGSGRHIGPVFILALLGLILVARLAESGEISSVEGTFTQTDSMAVARYRGASVALADGRVLVAGGLDVRGHGLPDAELFDPATGMWTSTGNLRFQRYGHGLALLNDGRVMVVGGMTANDCATPGISDQPELWDPATGVFTTTGSLTMTVPRVAAAVTTLADGRVLAAGGHNRCGVIYASAEVFDPATGEWTPTGELNEARYAAAPLLLPDGRVLLAGGVGEEPYPALASAEIYDPATGEWTLTGSMQNSRYWSGEDYSSRNDLLLLADGRVLTAGGISRQCNNWYTCWPFTYLESAEIYDPATGEWTATGSMTTSRGAHRMILLGNGQVLAVGGYSGTNTLSSAEIYDPATGTWALTAEMVIGRSSLIGHSLLDGSALVASGYSGYREQSSAEIFALGGTLNKVVNAGFESGSGIAWQEISANGRQLVTREWPRTSEFGTRLCGINNCSETIEQQVTVPASGQFRFWWYMTSSDSQTNAYDFLKVEVYSTDGELLGTVRVRNNSHPRNHWIRETVNYHRGAGGIVLLRFSSTTNASNPTTFFIDDISLK